MIYSRVESLWSDKFVRRWIRPKELNGFSNIYTTSTTVKATYIHNFRQIGACNFKVQSVFLFRILCEVYSHHEWTNTERKTHCTFRSFCILKSSKNIFQFCGALSNNFTSWHAVYNVYNIKLMKYLIVSSMYNGWWLWFSSYFMLLQ